MTPGLQRGAEGIGLYRSEIPFMTRTSFPSEEDQYEIYRHLIETYHPRPVTIRTLDVGGDKALPYFVFEEDNPALGWRGIRFSLDNRPVLLTQLRAMLRADEGFGTLRVMLPMISRVDELKQAVALLETAVGELARSGLRVRRPQLGIMVEVPAAVSLLGVLAPHVDFVSIGSNDLSQYLLAVDRNNPRVSARFDHLHPAVLRTVAHIVEEARRLQLEVSLCGEMASDPLAVPLLVGLGIDTLSMSSFHLPRIKLLIRSVARSQTGDWLERALGAEDESTIRSFVAERLTEMDLGHLLERAISASVSAATLES